MDDAIATADDLIEESASKFGFAKECVSHANPLVAKFRYIHDEGRRRTICNSERKEIKGVANINRAHKGGSCLTDAGEVTGGLSMYDKPNPDNVKLEFPHFSQAKVEAEKTRS